VTPGSVARRYAKALYELAAEEGAVDAIGQALAALAEAVKGVPAEQLAPGVLDAEARRKLGRALATPVGVDTTLGKFLRVVAERDRVSELPGVYYWYVKRLDEEAGRVRAGITSAVELRPNELQAVLGAFGKLAGREVVPEVVTDPELLGGVVVELEGRVYDGSVRTRLARLAAKMAGAEK
jgi:F-type H+-transporting ATPase subunit delta